MARDWKGANGLLILRHADRPSLKGLGKGADEVSITEKGRADSYALGLALGQATQVVASGVLRARQTAEEIMRAIGHESSSVQTFRSLCRLSANHADRAAYDAHKQRLGWHALVDAWIDGALDDPGAVLPSHESAMGALRELMAADGLTQQGLNIAITHDFYVHALLEVMHGQRQWRGRGIPTLAGVYLDYEDARTLIAAHGA
jgi:broad specificity phosphatase PhoE